MIHTRKEDMHNTVIFSIELVLYVFFVYVLFRVVKFPCAAQTRLMPYVAE